MNYETSFLTNYPTSYGSTKLLSDDLVASSSVAPLYGSSLPYSSGHRLLSDDLVYNELGLPPAGYSSSTYANYSPRTYQIPSRTHRSLAESSLLQAQLPIQDVREYSASLDTFSNTTTTASTAAHSMPDKQSKPAPHRVANVIDRPAPVATTFTTQEKPNDTHRSRPAVSPTPVEKKPVVPPTKKQRSPPTMPPETHHQLQRAGTKIDIPKQQSSVDVHAWLTEPRQDSSIDEEPVEHVRLPVKEAPPAHVQREKEKEKVSHTLPSISKPAEKPSPAGSKTSKMKDEKAEAAFLMRHDSYFDSLFQGNPIRKPPANPPNSNASYQQPFTARTKPPVNPIRL